MKMTSKSEKLAQLKIYFQQQPEISMAFIFGSQAGERARDASDWDIGVYFQPLSGTLEWEQRQFYPQEDKIWPELEQILRQEVDLVVLNRAPSSLAFSIISGGLPLVIKDQGLYLDFMLTVSREAEDFREFIYDFWKIKQKAASLSSEARERLLRISDFLEAECEDFPKFKTLTWEEYQNNRSKRREVERWIENIVNASLDIAKILLASERKPIPQTYQEMLRNLAALEGFEASLAEGLSPWVKLRNILAHQYLDLRWEQIRRFIKDSPNAYSSLINRVKTLLI